MARQVFDDWEEEEPASLEIARSGNEGALRPVITAEARTREIRRRQAHVARRHAV